MSWQQLIKHFSFIEGIFILCDEKGIVRLTSDNLEKILGYKPEDILGKRFWLLPCFSRRKRKNIFYCFNQLKQVPSVRVKNIAVFSPSRAKSFFHLYIGRVESSKESYFLIFMQDNTYQYWQKEYLSGLEYYYQLVSQNILEGIVISDFRGNILYANKAAANMIGLSSPEQGIGRNVLEFICNPWRKKIIQDYIKVFKGQEGFVAEYQAKRIDGRIIWVEAIGRKVNFQGKTASFNIIRDISERKREEESLKKAYDNLEIIIRQRTEELAKTNRQLNEEIKEREIIQKRLEDNLEKLSRVLNETVNALAYALEKRDLYTAGHQSRVSQLAEAIGRQMNFSRDRLNGLLFAAMVHDIGKICVPAEILSKPASLSLLEKKIIQEHPRTGYEILKTIEFPWPVAEVVYQHHERINGTGYPRKKKDILLEARIIAVADVVEAIAYHRPYRPALGIDAALKELEKYQGILYDKEVVKICLDLFYSKKFTFLS